MLSMRLFKRAKNSYIKAAIDSHEKQIEKAKEDLDRAIAALDGESKWFTCVCFPMKNKDNNNDSSDHNTCKHRDS